ncbi:hypothetical protein PZ938_15155 [Luteipulveratus sp. YIM 133132]|uniref:nucleotide-binding protein n=1 Tax=Luteipulveratus flavus TaxID=3031728 RepID=UPI0023B17D21|nr:hypothetical protein [Luteipulveratus sp. YIM 133132]MDE9366952.1 hypothetical protein [Luteipulveratus sp. YIM 133132]
MTSSTAAFTLAVVGGSGGSGASVLAGAVATRAARAGHRTVAVDLDPGGGGLDVVLGLEQEDGPRWRDLHGLRGAVDAEALVEQLPTTSDGVAALSFDRQWFEPDAGLTRALVEALRGSSDVVVLDRARGPFVPVQTDAWVLLAHGTLTGLAGAQVMADHLVGLDAEPWLVTRDVDEAVVHQVCEALALPLLAEMRHESAVETDLVRGVAPGRAPRSALSRVADEVLHELMIERRAVA